MLELLSYIPAHFAVDIVIAAGFSLAAIGFALWRIRQDYPVARRMLEAVLEKGDNRSRGAINRQIAMLHAERSRLFRRITGNEPYDVLLTVRARIEHEICRGTLGEEFDKGRIWTRSSEDIFVRQGSSERPLIAIDQVSMLADDKFKESVNRYLEALPNGAKPEFVSQIEIAEAHVSPLLLLGGLLEHLKEDWAPIIKGFGQDTARSNDPLPRKLRLFQVFIYDCWLVWGPSIPICGDSCENWGGSEISVLQLGYGDENNSVIMVGKKENLKKCAAIYARTEAPSFRARVTGTLKSPRSISVKDKSLYHYALKQALEADDRRLVLDVGGEDAGIIAGVGAGKDDRTSYYSAYLWIMLVMIDGDGQPVSGKGDEFAPWRALLPFFEHANIADRQTYRVLKKQLARKVVATIDTLAEELELDGRNLRFAYACSFDDPGCHSDGKSTGLAFPSDSESSIRDELLEAVANAPYINRDKANPKPIFDFTWARQGLNRPGNRFSACNLPKLVESYYQAVKRGAAP